MKHSPVVLITGTSTGIGRATVDELRRKGCHVIATARTLDDIRDLQGDQVEVYRLDVTDEASMQRVVDAVVEEHGRIDALVNNAGYGAMLPLEELPVEAMQRMFDVNVFGLHRLTQMVLPHMRTQDRIPGWGRGRIINIGSAAGHLSLPVMGAYCATKFAVRALTASLRSEVRRFGIRAVIVEPGSIKTNFSHRSIAESAAPGTADRNGPYAGLHHNWDRVREMAGGSGPPPSYIARMVRKAVMRRRPRYRYIGPIDAWGARFAARFVPDPLIMRLEEWFFWRGTGRRGNDARRET